MGLSVIDKRVVLPDQGKFNAGEKLNFMFLTASYPLFLLTGFLIWLPGVAFASWILHLSLAALATPLIVGHVFMATVNPDTRVGLQGMITGYVNRHWAQHHYRHWYNEHFGHLHRPPPPEPRPVHAAPADVAAQPLHPDAGNLHVDVSDSAGGRVLFGAWPTVVEKPQADQTDPEPA